MRHCVIDTADRIRPTDIVEIGGIRALVEGMDPANDHGRVMLFLTDPSGSFAQWGNVIPLEAGAMVPQHRDRPGYRGPLSQWETHTSVTDAWAMNRQAS